MQDSRKIWNRHIDPIQCPATETMLSCLQTSTVNSHSLIKMNTGEPSVSTREIINLRAAHSQEIQAKYLSRFPGSNPDP